MVWIVVTHTTFSSEFGGLKTTTKSICEQINQNVEMKFDEGYWRFQT